MSTADELHRQAWNHRPDQTEHMRQLRARARAYLLRHRRYEVAVMLGLLPDPGPEVIQ